MKRLLEPELMEDESQVKAYAEADFEIPHNEFIQRLKSFIDDPGFERYRPGFRLWSRRYQLPLCQSLSFE